MAVRGRDRKAAAGSAAREYIHHVAGERGPPAAWPRGHVSALIQGASRASSLQTTLGQRRRTPSAQVKPATLLRPEETGSAGTGEVT